MNWNPKKEGPPVAKVGKCPVCEREGRVITKHDIEGFGLFWSCADTEDCCRATMAAKSGSRSCDIPVGAIERLFQQDRV